MPRKPKSSTSEAPLAPIPSEILDQFVRQGPLTPEELDPTRPTEQSIPRLHPFARRRELEFMIVTTPQQHKARADLRTTLNQPQVIRFTIFERFLQKHLPTISRTCQVRPRPCLACRAR